MIWRDRDGDGNGCGGLSSKKEGEAATCMCRVSGECKSAAVVGSGPFFSIEDTEDGRRNVLISWRGGEAMALFKGSKTGS